MDHVEVDEYTIK